MLTVQRVLEALIVFYSSELRRISDSNYNSVFNVKEVM